MKKIIVILFGLTILGSVKAKDVEPLENYWKETPLSFPDIKSHLTNKECYESPNMILGCWSALITVLSFPPSKLSLAAPSQLNTEDGKKDYAEVVKDLGPLKIVKLIDHENDPDLPVIEYYAKLRRDKAAMVVAMNDLFAKKNTDPFDFEATANWVETEIFSKIPEGKKALVVGDAINEVLHAQYDPHTQIMPLRLFKEVVMASDSDIVGIGATIRQFRKTMMIESPREGSPALAAGVKPRDLILKVDNIDTAGKTLNEVVSKIKGPKGTQVTLTLKRGDQILNITITRDLIKIPNVESRIISDRGKPIGYLKLSRFVETSCDDMQTAILDFEKQKVSGMILDLRNNGGGLLDSAACVVGLFMGPDKTVVVEKFLNGSKDISVPSEAPEIGLDLTKKENSVTVKSVAGRAAAAGVLTGDILLKIDEKDVGEQTAEEVDKILKNHDETNILLDLKRGDQILNITVPQAATLPLVILINNNSASASEIVSGALQDYNRAYIVGDRTFGKATVQNVKQDSPSTVLLKTIARFYLPSGRTNQITGVSPDITIYSKPIPTEEDKFALREEDDFINPLSAAGDPYVPTRPQEIAALDLCTTTTGHAATTFTDHLNDGIAPDYQVLFSEDVLACAPGVNP